MNKKRYIASLLLFLTIVVSLAACSSETKLPRLAYNAVIVAFGDSITFGTGAQTQESYPAVLEKLTGKHVVNAGVPGEVTADGLKRLPEVLAQEKPALLLLCHGGNDMLRRLDERQTANNLRDMIRLARAEGVAVVIIAVPSPGILVSPSSIYSEVAKELSVPLEEKTLSEILADGSLKADYIHPNATGYRRLAEALAALLKKSGAID